MSDQPDPQPPAEDVPRREDATLPEEASLPAEALPPEEAWLPAEIQPAAALPAAALPAAALPAAALPAAPPAFVPAPPAPGPAPAWSYSAAAAPGKSRVLAAALALLLGGIGIHKFYLGKVGQGIVYVLFCWTGIPALVGWIEGILYLLKSNEAWAAEYGGGVEQPSGAAIGCLWLLALGPLLLALISIVAIIGLVYLGGQVSDILSTVGESI